MIKETTGLIAPIIREHPRRTDRAPAVGVLAFGDARREADEGSLHTGHAVVGHPPPTS